VDRRDGFAYWRIAGVGSRTYCGLGTVAGSWAVFPKTS